MSLIGVLTFILVLAVLVFFHELGHFLFAKLFRMKVEEFAIGFGPRLLRIFHDGETEYNIRALPLGGFVRIKGMEIEDATERRLTGAGEAPVPAVPGRDAAGLAGHFDKSANDSTLNKSLDSKEHPNNSSFETTNMSTLSQEAAEVSGADPDGFNSRPISQRFWVILGGPLFSFLFGWLAICLLGVTLGLPDANPTTVIGSVSDKMPAARAGLKAGDTVVAINNKPIKSGKEMIDILHASANKPLTLSVKNEKAVVRTVNITPEEDESLHIGLIGIAPVQESTPPKRVSLAESFAFGNQYTVTWFQQMVQIFSSPKKLGASVGGPVAILRYTNDASQQGSVSVVALMAQLSLSLGLFNLFPIPILDGGHLALMALEGIRGRKLTAEQTGRVFMVGFVLIGSLFVFNLFRDILGWVHK